MDILPRSFYAREPEKVARDLLGKVIVRRTSEGTVEARIVETEAYLGVGDPASHAHRGPTPRSRIMFGEPGHAYVYLNYGMYHLLNMVARPEGGAGAVLIRGVEPVRGADLMTGRRLEALRRRHRPLGAGPAHLASSDVGNGPGKLTIALGVTLDDNGADLTRGDLVVRDAEPVRGDIVRGPRVGVEHRSTQHLRFYLAGNPYVSRK